MVDDEKVISQTLAMILNGSGFRAWAFTDPLQALRSSETLTPDLLISDVVMPEMDGPTLLKEMRARNPNLKIIFVSGYAEEAFEKSLPENEQFAFLAKPFALSALIAKVKETMTPS